MDNISEFYTTGQKWIANFDGFIGKYALKGRAKPDHICYKCDSSYSFERSRKMFESEAKWIYQSIISGRRIAIIRLKKPFTTPLGHISVLELSDQKPDGSQKEGFDHIEFYPVGMTYEELVKYLEEEGATVTKIERPHHTTHNIIIKDGVTFCVTRGPLADKIKGEEMY